MEKPIGIRSKGCVNENLERHQTATGPLTPFEFIVQQWTKEPEQVHKTSEPSHIGTEQLGHRIPDSLGQPWENCYCDSFNARFRDEFLNGEIFHSLREAQILIEEWRKHYNTKRPHSALGHRPPATETIVQMDQRPVMH